MTGPPNPPLSSSQPDPRILAFLGRLQLVFLLIASVIASAVLLGWLVPPVDRVLPPGWAVMKLNTTLLTLGSCLSLYLWQPRRSTRALHFARVSACFILILAAATLVEYLGHTSLHIDTLLAADAQSALPGRLSLQTAWSFLFVGIILTSLRARKRTLASVVDLLTLVLILLVLTFISGYLFGAFHLYGTSIATRLAPQTLVCISLITFVIVTRRSEYGVLSILLGSGIGGKTARVAAPWALCLPFLLSLVRGLVVRFTAIPPAYTIALTASIMAVFGFCLVIALSRRTNQLENAIRDLSLRDELTRLYNRRGFYLLAEQALRLARRSREPFFVLFVDMDNLKLINDASGHDLGSEYLRSLGELLSRNFRETDVVARLGGDEFVVGGRADEPALSIALARLRGTAAALIEDRSAPYALEFSLGYVISEPGSNASLDQLVERADAIMYEAKRRKKQAAAAAAE